MRLLFVFLLASVGCATSADRLRYNTVDSAAMHRAMQYSVYTPPGFSETERLPLVVFLHGGGDDPGSFDDWGIGERLDRAIAEGRVPRVVIILPQGDLGFWANWRDRTRNYADWVTEEAIPDARERYHTADCPEHCHVMGVSMGGAGTVRFGLERSELFSSLGIISAPIFDTEELLNFRDSRLFAVFVPTHRIFGNPTRAQVMRSDPFARWQSRQDVDGLRLFVAWAEGDRPGIADSSSRLHDHLSAREIEHAHEEFSGGHNWVSWAPVIERALAYQLGHETP